MMRTFLVLFAAIYVAWGQDTKTVMTWERNVRGQIVRETAYFFEGKNQFIMESADYRLNKADKQILPSVSFHDYDAERPGALKSTDTGLTALKTSIDGKKGHIELCVITVPAKIYSESYQEAVRRHERTLPIPLGQRKTLKITDTSHITVEELENSSKALGSFCKDAAVYIGTEPDASEYQLFPMFRWWPWYLCFYYPYEILLPWWLWVWYF